MNRLDTLLLGLGGAAVGASITSAIAFLVVGRQTIGGQIYVLTLLLIVGVVNMWKGLGR